jgi:hypothetical protein
VGYHAKRGVQDYRTVISFADTHDLPLSAIAYIFNQNTNVLRRGDFEWESTTHAKQAARVIKRVRESTNGAFAHNRPFILALNKVMDYDEVDDCDELARKAAEAAEAGRLRHNTSIEDFVYDLIQAWNYYRRDGSDRKISILP